MALEAGHRAEGAIVEIQASASVVDRCSTMHAVYHIAEMSL